MRSVSQLVSDYLSVYPDEASRLTQLGALLAEFPNSADLIARTNFTGHLTASGFVLSADRRQLLLIAHRGLGMFLQPGGHLDPTDTSPHAGALREIREETGLTGLSVLAIHESPELPFDIDIHHIPANPRKGEPEHWHHDFRYLFVCNDDASMRLAMDEVTDARWVPLEQVVEYPTFERVGPKLQGLLYASA